MPVKRRYLLYVRRFVAFRCSVLGFKDVQKVRKKRFEFKLDFYFILNAIIVSAACAITSFRVIFDFFFFFDSPLEDPGDVYNIKNFLNNSFDISSSEGMLLLFVIVKLIYKRERWDRKSLSSPQLEPLDGSSWSLTCRWLLWRRNIIKTIIFHFTTWTPLIPRELRVIQYCV